ncbi:MAG: hypothetical protein U0U33_17090 [Chitinophagaceae bacterium]
MKRILLFIMLLPLFTEAQLSKKDSIWLPMNFFIGSWVGEGKGEPGNGKYERTYSWALNKKFIQVNNKSTYPPSDNNKQKGEVHEDIGFISYDGMRNSFMLRQFHIEGFVNQYKLESISADGKTIVFISEAIENIPQGYRARETYTIINQDEFAEVFEIADPGKDFAVYSEAHLKRK